MFFDIQDVKVICVSGQMPERRMSFMERRYGYRRNEKCSTEKVCVGTASDWLNSWTILSDGEEGWSQREGAVSFCRNHATRVLYYDELESMWVVGQSNEDVVKRELVKADNRFKGGETREFPLPENVFAIGAGQNTVEFLFHIGNLEATTKLHSFKQQLCSVSHRFDVPLSGHISVSPGQGIAITTVDAPTVLERPIELDYVKNMRLGEETMQTLENKMRRSYPPTCARVEAFSQEDYQSGSMLKKVRNIIENYLKNYILIKSFPDYTFSHARRKTEAQLRPGESRLHLLDRKNIFGNDEEHLRPFWLSEEMECKLFRNLLRDMEKDRDKCIQLLAWTYRGNNKTLQPLVKEIVDRYCSLGSITAVEVSFLSNFLAEKGLKDLEIRALETLYFRLVNETANGNDFRLFYNLLQFDEYLFDKFSDFFQFRGVTVISRLLGYIEKYRLGDNPNNYMSCLRVFLYFLRYRRKKRNFLRPRDWYREEPTGDEEMLIRLYYRAKRELEYPIDKEPDHTKNLREESLRFLEGNGTIEGLVTVIGEDK